MSGTNPGFDTQHIITFRVGVCPSAATTATAMRTADQSCSKAPERFQGVQAADFTYNVFKSGDNVSAFSGLSLQMPAIVGEAPRMMKFNTGPDYLRAMSIPPSRGRFLPRTTRPAPCVAATTTSSPALISRGTDLVGQTITFEAGSSEGPWPHRRQWSACAVRSQLKTLKRKPRPTIRCIEFDDLGEWLSPQGFPSHKDFVRTPLPVSAVTLAIKMFSTESARTSRSTTFVNDAGNRFRVDKPRSVFLIMILPEPSRHWRCFWRPSNLR